MLLLQASDSVREAGISVQASCLTGMIKRYYQVNRKDIALIQFIIEGYEGLATVTTADPGRACLKVSIVESQREDFDLLEADLIKTFGILKVPCP